ncbi:MAG: CocE/NonD family hydrolase [Actinomycetota bacterium]
MRKLALFIAGVIALASFSGSPASAAVKIERGSILSFDQTKIVYNLFLPDGASATSPVPVIFMTHGWGGSGQQTVSGFLQRLLENGYAVLTWDARGFGQSGGDAYVDDPLHEVKDTQALIDFVATKPEIQKDDEEDGVSNDPRMGMVGGSYAGGIQLATAAFDRRVDAIVPDITWNDLRYSLFPHGVIKFGWDQLLYADGLATSLSGGLNPTNDTGIETGSYAPFIHRSEVVGAALNGPDDQMLSDFGSRSLAEYGQTHPIRIPTLLTQGLPDTLFNVNEALKNFDAIRAPHKLIAYCGGHAGCPYVGPGTHVDDETLAWLDRYVKGDDTVVTGAPMEYQTNDGAFHSVNDFRDAHSSVVNVTGTGTVLNTGLPTSAQVPASPGLGTITTASVSAANDPGTLTIPTTIGGGTTIVGVPHATLTLTGTGLGTHLFLKLVDVEANSVIDGQETAIAVPSLGSAPMTVDLDMIGVAYIVPAGHHIALQIATSSLAMTEGRNVASVNIAASVTVPTL